MGPPRFGKDYKWYISGIFLLPIGGLYIYTLLNKSWILFLQKNEVP